MNSTALLEPMLASEGVLTQRGPTDSEQTDITYGGRSRTIYRASTLARRS